MEICSDLFETTPSGEHFWLWLMNGNGADYEWGSVAQGRVTFIGEAGMFQRLMSVDVMSAIASKTASTTVCGKLHRLFNPQLTVIQSKSDRNGISTM